MNKIPIDKITDVTILVGFKDYGVKGSEVDVLWVVGLGLEQMI